MANAREARAVPGRKSDVNDAQWLQRLHACGLLRASFRPGRDIAALRVYLRLRERHLDYAAAHIQHMQKALTFMNLQLHHVVSGRDRCNGDEDHSRDRQRRTRPPGAGDRCATCAARPAWRPSARPWWATTSPSTSLRSPRRWRCTTSTKPVSTSAMSQIEARARCAQRGEGKSECSIAEGAAPDGPAQRRKL